jgi:hypothetical protein
MEFGSSQRINIGKPNLKKIRIDDYDNDNDVKNFLTTIDIFDAKLYSETIQGKTKFETFQKDTIKKDSMNSIFNLIRFKESINIFKLFVKEKDTISNYLFQSGVAIDPLALKGGFKKKLSRIHKNANWKKKTNKYEQCYNSNDVVLKRRVSNVPKIVPQQTKNLGIFENYETNDNPTKKKESSVNKSNSYKPPYTSTLNIFNTQKKDILVNDFNIPDLNISKDFKLPDDSVFSNRSRIVQKNRFNRPEFVEKLFENYDYNDLDPWNRIQNHTKNKNLCLSVIKDLYNKITY